MRNTNTVRGFTLIELMIALAIVAILAAVVYPGYREYVLRGERTQARSALLDAAQRLERCFTRFNRYDDDRCTVRFGIIEGGRYDLSGSEIDSFEFALTATRLDPPDPRCSSFTLNQRGRRGASGTLREDCW